MRATFPPMTLDPPTEKKILYHKVKKNSIVRLPVGTRQEITGRPKSTRGEPAARASMRNSNIVKQRMPMGLYFIELARLWRTLPTSTKIRHVHEFVLFVVSFSS